MQRTYTNRRYLDLLQDRVLIFDGAMGTSLQKMNLTAAHFGGEKYVGCNDHLVISYPQAVEQVHRSFLDVGVDVVETCTFRANPITLAEYGLQDKVYEINLAASSLARRIADEYSRKGQTRFVAGSIGPSGKLPSMNDPELSNISYTGLADIFRQQAKGLLEGGVDLILIETSQDILEVKAAITGIHEAFSETNIWLPIQAQVSLDTTGRMLLGTDSSAVLAILEGLPIDVIGLNCSTGPDYMREPIRYLGSQSSLPVSCIPNAGLPLNIDGQAVYPLEPQPFADMLAEFVHKYQVSVVGGCCGTTPEHLRALVLQVKDVKPISRPSFSPPRLASASQATPMQQEPAPFLIGERLNTQGSKKFKELVLRGDYDGILELARQQVESGAHGLDLCVALTEQAGEAETLRKVVKILSPVIRAPLIFDTTEPDVMEIGLQNAPGRCLLNSTNLEAGRAKADRVFGLASKYNAAVIALTIDEAGMAKTAQRKLEIARRLYQMATQDHHLRPADLVFDALTFTLATGDPEFASSAIETLNGIRLIKQALPGVLTSLGVSNVSFGLSPSARTVINSVMLYHAVQYGLDMAIVNPAQITPYSEIDTTERMLAEDLIFNRRADALQNVIEHFQGSSGQRKNRHDDQASILKSLKPEERLPYRIIHRLREGIESDIDALILESPAEKRSSTAVEVLNNLLLPAMKEVGDQFGRGELILPFVLQSAEVMKKAVAHLENYLEKQEGVARGIMVLATVYGDVHDIGKNLVKTILSNNGYRVIDLGKQVPAETIIQAAVEHQADAIGLSALLVSTSRQMPLIVNELQRRNLKFPVLIGGAAINRRFGRRILRTEDDQIYQPGVFYCKDAFEGLAVMNDLMNTEKRPQIIARLQRESDMELNRQAANAKEEENLPQRSSVRPAPIIPVPSSWGVRIVRQMPLDAVFQCLSINELFRLSWGARNTHGAAWDNLQAEYFQRLDDMRRAALRDPWLFPQGVYGYFPAQADGNDLVLFSPDSVSSGKPVETMRFSFPRQDEGEYLCLADYFEPIGSERMDVAIFQVVTVGAEATSRFEHLQSEGNYSEAYFTHGLAVQMAEAAAEYLHRHIRQEIGIPPDQGKRYSWGYPSIPHLADHEKVFSLLPAQKALGMSLTSAFQLVPEQSTAAIIIHHPEAKYYNLGESRIDQLMKG
ncbi:MAG TPA: methionine synthase [Anaerolineaceae bacterium]